MSLVQSSFEPLGSGDNSLTEGILGGAPATQHARLQPIWMLGMWIMSSPSTMPDTILGSFQGSKGYTQTTTPSDRCQDQLSLTHEQAVQKVRAALASVTAEFTPSPTSVEDDTPLRSLLKGKGKELLTDSLGPHGTTIVKLKIKSIVKKRLSKSVKVTTCNAEDDSFDGSIPLFFLRFQWRLHPQPLRCSWRWVLLRA